MKILATFLACFSLITFTTAAPAALLYVSTSSTNPVPPYAGWSTAATNIQDAVDMAVVGDDVLVTNGVYQTGGRAVYGVLTNRIAVDKAITVRSVNGPAVTEIRGFPESGDSAVRCAYLTNGATLTGFTLTQGATRDSFFLYLEREGGGVFCESRSAVVSNCVFTANTAVLGGAAYSGTIFNSTFNGNNAGRGGAAEASELYGCTVSGNAATGASGGGGAVSFGALTDCTIQGNSGFNGGGTYSCSVTNCTISDNVAWNAGGGANSGTLVGCRLAGNSAGNAGGAFDCTVFNSRFASNSASYDGGAANYSVLNNCALFGNRANGNGGGANATTLNNCTVVGNASAVGGGVNGCGLNNSIVYYNSAGRGPNYFGSSANFSCTTPLPLGGTGNLNQEPLLTDMAHLSSTSPCRGAGSAGYAAGADLDGEAWGSPPAIGCDEFVEGAVTGDLSVMAQAAFTNLATGFAAEFTAQISGRASANRWEFGDGSVSSNRPSVSHSWSAPGVYDVVFRAFNDSNPGGVSATVSVHLVAQPVHYVAAGNATPVAPYESWATAAANIQDAVEAASAAGALVLVTNGIYDAGGKVAQGSLSNRVAVTKPLVIRSVNGPALTTIQGYQEPGATNGDSAVRCVYLTGGATLSGFTLTNGATRNTGDELQEQSGGGVRCEPGAVVSNCVLIANAANSAGGGASGGNLSACTIARNCAANNGGGAFESVLNNCVVAGNIAANAGGAVIASAASGCILTNNLASSGGGAQDSRLNNCALFGNVATGTGGGATTSTLHNCTLTGNTAAIGGGAADCALHNSITWYNAATRAANYSGGSADFSCTTPLPAGAGNTVAEPQLADFAHVSTASPCRGAGSAAYTTGTDIDGEPWLAAPSIGCDESYSGGATGLLTVNLQAAQTNLATGFAASFVATLSGHASGNQWSFGDGTVLSNRLNAAHAWTNASDFPVVFSAFNDSNPGGVSATVIVHVVSQPVHYVALNSATPFAPYSSWATAAPDIQSAVDAASVAGALVLVSNGTYQTGGRVVHGAMTNRAAITKPLLVQSVNGPAVTVIKGNPAGGTNAVRCVYLASGATLNGFTLTNGMTLPSGDGVTELSGGGVWCEPVGATVINCVIAGNSAASVGGGAYSGTLVGCSLSGNSASAGGGAHSANLSSCTVSNNSGFYSGGADSCTLDFCAITGNTGNYGGGARSCTVSHSTFTGNHSSTGGGGADSSALDNCLLFGNSASEAGAANSCSLANCTVAANACSGISYSTANNSIMYDNARGNLYESTVNYTCTTPLPDTGTGNITNAPLFLNPATGNFHLQTNSPCVNAGNNAFAAGATDLDGRPRVYDGTVDMGAYENQPVPPLAQTLPATGVTTTSATLNGAVTANGLPCVVWFEWGTNSSYGHATAAQAMGSGFDSMPVSAAITGLIAGHTYQFRLVASNQVGVVFGAAQSFTTGRKITAWGSDVYGQVTVPAGLSNIVAVAGGRQHSLALRADGTVAAWGGNSDGQATVPPGLSNVVAISAGSGHSLALKADGTVVAWGMNSSGEANVPAGLNGVMAVAGAMGYSLALKSNGTVVAWGDNTFGETNVPPGLSNVVAVAGGSHGLALKADGRVVAWGDNSFGQTNVPPNLSNVVAVAAGQYHSLALKSDGTVVGWGYTSYGAAIPPAGLSNVVRISAGVQHSLATKADGTLVAWGNNFYGEASVPKGLSNVLCAVAGGHHDLAIGPNLPPVTYSQLVSGPLNQPLVVTLRARDFNSDPLNLRISVLPTAGLLFQCDGGAAGTPILTPNTLVTDSGGRVIFVPGTNGAGMPYATFTFVAQDDESVSQPATVTIRIGSLVYTHPAMPVNAASATLAGMVLPNGLPGAAWFEWGGKRSFSQKTTPVEVGGGDSIVRVTKTISGLMPGGAYQCRLVVSNSAGVFRGAAQNFISGGSLTGWGVNGAGQLTPPPNLANVAAISAGWAHNLALTTDRTVLAWGEDIFGQTAVPGALNNVVEVAAGRSQSVARKADGTLSGWGYGAAVPNVTNAVALAAGWSHGLAVRDNGTVAAWGSYLEDTNLPPGLSNVVAVSGGVNYSLALQIDGTVSSYGGFEFSPTNLPPELNNVIAIASGLYHCLALKADGTVVAWGDDPDGQATVPPGLSNVVAIAAGGFHCAALKSDGTLVIWGQNSYGQANVPNGLTNAVAVSGGGYFTVALTGIYNTAPQAPAQTVAGPQGQDLVVHLEAFDADGDPLTLRITALPQAGALYQFNNGVRGAPITALNTVVTDPLQRLIFAPAPSAAGNPYTTFRYVANDGQVDSASAIVSLQIFAPAQPFAFTQAATQITTNTAMLNGMATPNGPPTSAWFEWGERGSYTRTTTPVNVGSGNGVVRVSTALSNLLGGRSYQCRLVASNSVGVVYGAPQAFAVGSLIRAWGRSETGETNAPATVTNGVAVGAGAAHNLVVRNDGTVVGWGNNIYGQRNIPAGLANVIAVDGGAYHSVALRANGTVAAWGDNGSGQTNVPPGLSNVIAIAAGIAHNVALKADGTLTAWGLNSSGESEVPAGLSNVVAVAAGNYHTLALKADGTITGWGPGVIGPTRSIPAGLSNVVALAGGSDHSLALKSDGTVVAWGDNFSGETNQPPGLSNVIAIAAGGPHSVALRSDGTVVAWGYSAFGATNVPPDLTAVVSVATGAGHNVALLEDKNASPQVLAKTATGVMNQDLVIGLTGFDPGGKPLAFRVLTLPAVGALFQYDNGARGTAITINDTAVSDLSGRVIYSPAPDGVGDPYASFRFLANNGLMDSPAAVLTIRIVPPTAPLAHTSDATEVRATSARLNGFATANGLAAVAWFEWGPRGGYSQSTDPTAVGSSFDVAHTTQTLTNLTPQATYQVRLVVSNEVGVTYGAMRLFSTGSPVAAWGYNYAGQVTVPPGLSNAVAVAAGDGFSVVAQSDGTLSAWGRYYNGTAYVPMFVPAGLSNVAAIVSGPQHPLALRTNGTVAAWGSVYLGSAYVPASVPAGLSNVLAISAAFSHNLALRTDGTVVAWGNNTSGQTNVPPGLSNVVEIAACSTFSLALKADGRVVAWGQWYDGTSWVPVTVPDDLNDITSVAELLAVRRNGTVVAWALGPEGQTNVPSSLSNVVAITAGGIFSALRSDGTVVEWGTDNTLLTNIPPGLNNGAAVATTWWHSLAMAYVPPQALAQTAFGPLDADLVVTLTGADANSDPLNFRISALPAAGKLFQYNGGTHGAMISAPDSAVADAHGRVVYAPPAGPIVRTNFSFSFVANDGSADSAPAQVTIQLVAEPPFVTTQPATRILTNQATLNGMATPNGLSTAAWFEWGRNNQFDQATAPTLLGSGLGVVAVNATLTNLIAGQVINFRLVASNAAGVVRGADRIFTTSGRVTAWGNNTGGQLNVPAYLRRVVQVGAGNWHSAALINDGSGMAWGSGSVGQNVGIADGNNIASIAEGGEHGLGLLTNSTVLGWGQNNFGQITIPAGLSNVVGLAAGGQHSMALRADGSMTAWGINQSSFSNALLSVSNVVSICAGWFHSIALFHDGTVAGWGTLGVPAELTNVVSIAAGSNHSLALLRDGSVIGWGENTYNQTVTPPGVSNVVFIQAWANQSAALRRDGMLFVWGANQFNQTNVPAGVSNVATFAVGAGHVLAVTPNRPPIVSDQSVAGSANADLVIELSGSDAEADAFTFAIRSLPTAGAVYQYSGGVRGSVITTVPTAVSDPDGRIIFVPAPGGLGIPYARFDVSANDGEVDSTNAAVAVSIIGKIFARTLPATQIGNKSARLEGFVAPESVPAFAWFEWGTNINYGQTTTTTDVGSGRGVVHVGEPIAGLASGQLIHFRLVASNASQTIYGTDQQFVSGGKVFGWGDNSSGQSATPANLGAVVSLAGGLSHSLALRTDGTVAAWGNNVHGQTNVPAGLAGVVASIAAGGFHNLTLRTNGNVVAWGRNSSGQTNVPASATNVVAIAAGGQHSLALRANGSLVAWGDNSQGQRTVSASLSNVVGIAAGWYHNVALRSDGTVAAWGANTYGQSTVPAGLTNVVWVGAGLYHSLALRSDGPLVAWGLNTSGQTNLPPALTNIAVAACGGSHNLALQPSGQLAGWGYNFFGQATSPANLSNAVTLAAGGSHSLALLPNHLPVALDQVVAGYPNTDLLVTLAGADADNEALAYRISVLPSAGAVYQVAAGLRGAQIINPNTTVSDALGRLIFTPAANQIGSPHAAFGFTASDGFADSPPATVTTHIVLPIAPILDFAASGVTTNGEFQLAFTGASNASYRVWGSTNLLNWEVLGTAASLSAGQFLFLDATATNWPQRFYRATAP